MLYTEANTITLTCNGALGQGLRVKLSAGVLALAGASDFEIGVMQNPTFSGDTRGTVRLRNSIGTLPMVAVDAITAGDTVYAAASGKVSATGTIVVGIARTTTTADGDFIEIVPRGPSDMTTDSGTTNATFTVDSDATIPKIALASYVGGTGDYTATIKAPATLAGNITVTIPAVTSTLATLAGTETLTNKTLTSPTMTAPVLGVATGTSVAVTGLITSSSPSAGIGYATGAGAAASQSTDRTTTVVCTGTSGAITTQATSLAAGAAVQFTVTNTSVAVGDVVIASIRSGPTNTSTSVHVVTVGSGSFKLQLRNDHASVADTGAAIINFAVIKAVSA